MEKPRCIGIIMDGNRRWAKEKGLPTLMGHKKGYDTLKDVLGWAKEVSINTLIIYALSEENWKRTQEEVGYLLDLFRKAFFIDAQELIDKKVKVKFIGNLSKFSDDLRDAMKSLEEKTKDFIDFNFVVAVSYGGKEEIVHAVNTHINNGGGLCTTSDIEKNLYTAGLPDPDMIIRTSGEQRLSGFLLWQSFYSELFFTKTLWPDFSKEEFLGMIEEYSQRQRRMGV
ncbi:MAG: polyprenyl diphosphate synthase [Minisyncoccota bacterium]